VKKHQWMIFFSGFSDRRTDVSSLKPPAQHLCIVFKKFSELYAVSVVRWFSAFPLRLVASQV